MDKNTLIELVTEYFKKIDAGDSSYLDLFHDDVTFFFPKFGDAVGKQALLEFGDKIGSSLNSIWHDIAHFNFIVSGKTVVVEGREGGVMRDGTHWPDNQISSGRFCSVFEFSDNLITRMHIYVDPDFSSQDSDRISILSR
ncbi:nuclear transport factor 2 family protein [Pseudoalteromonas sp. A22]|uniref:nuclear transport factor 2 family protein n=1 Tax=Pseudoalteromonas TaxID=53246 RepID=UPI001BA87E0E|nr:MULTISPECIES: nuclear transport factor 2 family protein [Pseudoalteromonas]QUI61838.1 nuclear transport factor 2 family protein [Pseudoalteromonas sp. A22]USE71690.1 hypothetical protein CTT31_21660 [Pseudoalteromonas flavipulchra]